MSKTKGIFAGNYQGSSGNIESFGVQKALNTLEPSIRGKKVEITHDHDNKTHGVLKKLNNNDIIESLDPGHDVQEIRRKANKHFENYSRDLKDEENPKRNTYIKCFEIFSALIEKIVVWFKFLLFNVKAKDEKESMWLNMSEHVMGNHQNCIHPDNLKSLKKTGRPKKNQGKNQFWTWEEAIDDKSLKAPLDDFLKENIKLVRNTGIVRTQHNESANAMMTQVLPKNKVFNTNNEPRSAVAVGRKNNHNFDSDLIQKLCPNKLAPAILDEIKKDENNAHDESLVRNTRSFRKRKNEARSKVRESNKSSSGDYKPK